MFQQALRFRLSSIELRDFCYIGNGMLCDRMIAGCPERR